MFAMKVLKPFISYLIKRIYTDSDESTSLSRTCVDMSDTKSSDTNRIWQLDFLRGSAITAMILFHFTFDLSYFGLIASDTIYRPNWVLFQQIIASTFLLTAGISFDLCHANLINWAHIKRRIIILGTCAILISLVTILFFGKYWIKFGIIHCILACSLLSIITVRANNTIVVAITAALVLGYLICTPPISAPAIFSFIFRTEAPHYSMDYRPIFPWVIVFHLGILVSRFYIRKKIFVPLEHVKNIGYQSISFIVFLGKNSLLIYLLHQPILFLCIQTFIHLPRN